MVTQTAPDLFYHHLIDLKGRPSEGVPDAHMLVRCPHTADGIAALAIFPRNANKMKVGFGGSWGWQLGKWRGLKVGSNLPISQLGVLKCLARGQTGGSEQAARNIIIKQCIVKSATCATGHFFASFHQISASATLQNIFWEDILNKYLPTVS